MNERKTKQKDDILKIIKKSKDHPTIKEIYLKVKEINPTIGQATIYRNINRLAEEGKIERLVDPTNEYHYDGDISYHNHFVCKNCNTIIDIFDDYQQEKNNIEKTYSVTIEKTRIVYEGICNNCKK